MRYIKGLTSETLNILTRIYKSSNFPQVRTRALCIKLSNQGYTINELIEIFKVSRNTIYNWFNNFEKMALAGLYNNKGRGRKNILNKAQITKIKEWVEAEPKNLNNVKNKIKEEWQITISKDTIKRTLKKQNMKWKRLRRVPSKKPKPKLYKHKLKAIEKLKILEEQGKLEIRYGDESGFSLISCLPYAWQQINKQIEIPSQKSARLNVIGFMTRTNKLDSYLFNCNINSQIVIQCIDKLASTITQKTVLILDNSSVHKNKLFSEKKREWHNHGLTIFFLPTYSPHLNIIEILWRFIKYQWLPIDAFKDFVHLTNAVEEILINFGEKYTINFA